MARRGDKTREGIKPRDKRWNPQVMKIIKFIRFIIHDMSIKYDFACFKP